MSLKKEFKKTFIPLKNWLKVQASFFLHTKDLINRKADKPPHADLNTMIIASITSYPARFRSLHLTLKSIILQNTPADKILLWIAHNDRPYLPKNILKLEEQNLIEIHLTEDTRSYKKIIPSLSNYPNATIVTFDDDVFYPKDTLKKLIELSQLYPNRVIANRTHQITCNQHGLIDSYQHWIKNSSNQKQPQVNFQTGIGGVLYPPRSLSNGVMEHELFMQLAPHGDDIWLYWMMRLNGNIALQTVNNNFEFYHWPFSQKTALYKQNVRQDGNDVQIQAMLAHFGNPLEMPVKPYISEEDKTV
ncbi:hypothetical protein [Thiomicrorhabdus indica]|uniref:hypothetical protein n=1 Tax=Thiomicrorhabdus indica TaxID=2267253 RepID=UPI002AA6C634|nr:hypothetical protein [Thiomicrorhabdus indica]